MAMNIANKRLAKELAKLHQSIPPGITLVSAEDFKEWLLDIRVLDPNPIYKDQTYRLRFTFPPNYPIEPPEVVFLKVAPNPNPTSTPTPTPPNSNLSSNPPPIQAKRKPLPTSPTPSSTTTSTPSSANTVRPIPIHPHIYSNGIICLDLLGRQGWSPVQNVESICMSLQSMLTGNTKNERPEGDQEFVLYNTKRPRDIEFYYHDDGV